VTRQALGVVHPPFAAAATRAVRAIRAGFPPMLTRIRRFIPQGSIHAFASDRLLTPFSSRTYDDCGAVKALTNE